MRIWSGIAALIAVLLVCGGAQAQTTPLETYIYSTAAAAPPYPSNLYIPAAPSGANNALQHIPASTFATLTDPQELDNKTLGSPVLTGVPTAPTAAPGTSTNQIATTAFVTASGGGGGPVTQATVPWVETPRTATTSQNGVSVTTGDTFQTVLVANSSRIGCTIQYTGSTTGYVFFGANASATEGASFQLAPLMSITCGSRGSILTDNVSVTSHTAGDTFVVAAQ